ncbi:MAG: Uncharacterised protein [Synechococcus sp. CC9902]|nr:MAG: Uncharacterised protein [Synechococcus sp. CC9902]
MQLISAPPQLDFLLQLTTKIIFVKACQWCIGLQPLQQVGHPPLLMTNGVSNDLGGMGGEDQSNVQLPQQCFHLRGWNIHSSQPLEHRAECRRVGLAGERRCEGIEGVRFDVVLSGTRLQTVEIAVFLDALLEDVDQLEVQRERPGRGDRL